MTDTGLVERLRGLDNYDVGERPWTATELAEQAASRIEALEGEVERLRAAISWLDGSFIDRSTSRDELLSRIGFMIADANRARSLSQSEGGGD